MNKISGHVKVVQNLMKSGTLNGRYGKLHIFHRFNCCIAVAPTCDCTPRIQIKGSLTPLGKQDIWESVHYHKDKVWNLENTGMRSISWNKGDESYIQNYPRPGEEKYLKPNTK